MYPTIIYLISYLGERGREGEDTVGGPGNGV